MIIHYFTLLYVFAPSIFSSSFFSFFECKDSYFFSLVMTRDSFKYTFLSVVALKYGLGSHRSGFLPDLILGNFDDTPTLQSIPPPSCSTPSYKRLFPLIHHIPNLLYYLVPILLFFSLRIVMLIPFFLPIFLPLFIAPYKNTW